jgi:hypothetical protein
MVPISDMAGPDSESGNDAMMRPILFFRLIFRFSFFSDSMSFDEFLFFEFFYRCCCFDFFTDDAQKKTTRH